MGETENLDEDLVPDLDMDMNDDELNDLDDISQDPAGLDIVDTPDEAVSDEAESEALDASEPPQGIKRWLNKKTLIVASASVGLGLLVIALFVLWPDSTPKSGGQKAGAGAKSSVEQELFKKQSRQKKKKKKVRRKKIKYVTLYKQLTGVQLSEVLRELSYESIPFNVVQTGKQFDVFVDKQRLEEAKKILAIKELPTGPVKGFEIFDEASNLGATEFDKRIRLIRAISGEMEKSIMRFEAIDNVQVEIVIPEQKLFAVTQPPVTASILIRKHPDAIINDELVFAIIQLVANSVESLQPENISVVDTTGRVLSVGVLARVYEKKRQDALRARKAQRRSVRPVQRRGIPIEPTMDDVLNWFQVKYNYESILEKKAMDQLLGVLPEGTYKVAVTIDLDSVKKSGTPDIKRIVTSVVIDSTREDIELDEYTQGQIKKAAAGAVGFVDGRDEIYLSRAEFLPKVAEKDAPVVKKTEKKETAKKGFRYYLKYWPIAVLGYGTLALFYLLYRTVKGVKDLVRKVVSLFKKPTEDAPLEEEVPEFEDTIEEVEDDLPEDIGLSNEAALERIQSTILSNPKVVGRVLQEWLEDPQEASLETSEFNSEEVALDDDSNKEDPFDLMEEDDES
ncbi:hypothetical protein DID77_04840 [Candidatus Marinamargulisbacteria bacterium SCGC AG-439-L15]|nr:hypothetical protein DID77_04840 [Candidatus Marinamargulisbacteria bacterium SCGC AG-439-L15]